MKKEKILYFYISIFIPAIILSIYFQYEGKTKAVIPKTMDEKGKNFILLHFDFYSCHYTLPFDIFSIRRQRKNRNTKRQANEKAWYRNKKVEESDRKMSGWWRKRASRILSVRFLSSVSWKIFAPAVRTLLQAKRNRPWVSVRSRPPPAGHRPLFVREARITTPLCQYVSADISCGEAARYFYRSRRANSYLPTPLRHAATFTSPFHTLRRSTRDPLSAKHPRICFPFQRAPSFSLSFHARIFESAQNFFRSSSFSAFCFRDWISYFFSLFTELNLLFAVQVAPSEKEETRASSSTYSYLEFELEEIIIRKISFW